MYYKDIKYNYQMKWREPMMNVRVYLHVPFDDKEQAKELGCHFDWDRKKWYCIDSDYGKSNVSQCIEIWDEPEPYKIINGIEYPLSEIPKMERGYTSFDKM